MYKATLTLYIMIKNILITPAYILGLTDAEGMFGLIVNDGGGPTGDKFSLEFKITQKSNSRPVLEAIKDFFDCGRIAIDNSEDDTLKFVVTDLSSILTIIIPFFIQNMLLSSKYLNFKDFERMSIIMSTGAHLTLLGAQELLFIYSGMNKKRSWLDKYTFMASHSINITAGWLQGFIDGDGSFTTWLGLSAPSRKTRHMVLQLFLELKQNSHDVLLLQAIIVFLGVGTIRPTYDIYSAKEAQASRAASVLTVRQTRAIIEFVDSHPMMTNKALDYDS